MPPRRQNERPTGRNGKSTLVACRDCRHMRHGLIGPYSVQPMQFRVSRTAGSARNVGEYAAQMKSVMTTSLPGKMAKMEVSISAALGMAMDYDDDRQVIKFSGDQKPRRPWMSTNSGRSVESTSVLLPSLLYWPSSPRGRAAEFGARTWEVQSS